MNKPPITISEPASGTRMKTIFITCPFLLLLSIFTLNAYGGMESYLVVFEEGYFEQEKGRLYQAKVTVYRGGKKLRTNGEIRGSTLPNRFLYYLDKNRPVIAPGEYRFDVKYSGKFKKALCLNGGGYTDTINPNPNKQGRYVANGIWVHKGRTKGPVKGSEGCLTIAPGNWNEFINLFPVAEEWKQRPCQGKIIITRDSDEWLNRPGSPSNLRVRTRDQR